MDRLYGVLGVSKEVLLKMVDGIKKKKTFGCILIFFSTIMDEFDISRQVMMIQHHLMSCHLTHYSRFTCLLASLCTGIRKNREREAKETVIDLAIYIMAI